ncbi:hypothetical protein [Streptomyces albus]|nr:hypothetical protein [Streptomyces albus]
MDGAAAAGREAEPGRLRAIGALGRAPVLFGAVTAWRVSGGRRRPTR